MRLLILSDSHVIEKEGIYFSPDPWLKITEYLEPFFSRVCLCIPVEQTCEPPSSIPLNRSWEQKRIHWKHTIAYKSVVNYYKLLPYIVANNLPVVVDAVRDCDAVFMRLPAMNGYMTALVARLLGKPLVCYFSGDQRLQIINGGKYRGLWYLPARMAAVFHDFLYQRIVKGSIASLFEGDLILKRYASTDNNSYFMFPSLIEEREIWSRQQSSLQEPPRNLLFAGSLDKAKGIDFLLEALAHLFLCGIECRLTICGEGPEGNALKQLTNHLGLADRVSFRGHVKWGKDLDEVYRETDILIHPSLSEGVPKVILEAMAKGVAIVATAVGGVPGVITDADNGILVQPKSSRAISDAVIKLVRVQGLRNQLVQGGYAFIKQHTAEKQAKEVATIILESVKNST